MVCIWLNLPLALPFPSVASAVGAVDFALDWGRARKYPSDTARGTWNSLYLRQRLSVGSLYATAMGQLGTEAASASRAHKGSRPHAVGRLHWC